MQIAVLGTGVVGANLATKLAQAGHQVKMGSRTNDNVRAATWAQSAGANASHDTFAEAARFGEVVFNCTSGMGSLDALKLAGADNLRGKILIDVANALDFSKGMPPSLAVCNTDSLGEQIQRAFPDVKVVKTLNTMTTNVMVNPRLVPGDHTVFIGGNDADAKARVSGWLTEWFGWKPENIVDLGDIMSARGTEMLLPIWLRLWNTFGTPNLNFHIVVAPRT